MGGLISNLFLFYGTALAYGRPILEIPFAGRFFCSSLRGVETTIRLTRPVRPCPLLLETQRPFTTGKLTRSDVVSFTGWIPYCPMWASISILFLASILNTRITIICHDVIAFCYPTIDYFGETDPMK